jgi:hypothetical protein
MDWTKLAVPPFDSRFEGLAIPAMVWQQYFAPNIAVVLR